MCTFYANISVEYLAVLWGGHPSTHLALPLIMGIPVGTNGVTRFTTALTTSIPVSYFNSKKLWSPWGVYFPTAWTFQGWLLCPGIFVLICFITESKDIFFPQFLFFHIKQYTTTKRALSQKSLKIYVDTVVWPSKGTFIHVTHWTAVNRVFFFFL